VSLDKIEERGTTLYADRQDEPDTGAEVFYNPEMRTNRDLSVAAAETYFSKGASVLDATAASGIRAFRYSAVAEDLVINDTSKSSVEAVRRGLDANDVDAEVVQRDARRLLADRQYEFDLVDIDPYGSFLPFLDPAATAVRREGLVGLTATDLAGPAGSYPTLRLRSIEERVHARDRAQDLHQGGLPGVRPPQQELQAGSVLPPGALQQGDWLSARLEAGCEPQPRQHRISVFLSGVPVASPRESWRMP